MATIMASSAMLLLPDSHSVRFNEEQFAMVELLRWMFAEKGYQPTHELRNYFRVIVKLNRDDAQIAGRRIGHDVAEVTVQRHKNCVEFLRFGDDNAIGRANGQNVAQQSHLMTVSKQSVRDFCRHALVAEEPQAHAAVSNSASSRA